jgi:acyl-CoA dehydrogenase
MRVEVSEELAELRRGLRAFVEAELFPLAADVDRAGTIPRRAWDTLRRQGLLGLLLPTEYGGAAADLPTYCLAMEEVARAHRVFTLLLDATSGLTPVGILRHGTEAQRARWLPGLCAGDLRAAFGLTEPDCGSDAAALKTRAERVPQGWRLNGRKQWISGAHEADVVMVMAVTDPGKRGRGRISAFLVPRNTAGMAVTRVDSTIGSAAIQLADLAFDDCMVPEGALLGAEGEGFAIAMASLTHGRLGVSAACIGAADRLLAMSIAFAKSRQTFGAPLADRQAIQWMLADSAVEIETARAFTYDTLRRHALGQEIGPAASMAKLYCSEMVGRVADRAVQVHGGAGIVRGDFPVERFYRDVRHYRIGEGSSEIQRILIARHLLA